MKLFHCIVVMGAALGTDCGSRGGDLAGLPSTNTRDASTDTAAARDDGGCAQNGFKTPGCFYTGSCRGTPAAPLGPADCAHAQQLHCDPASSGGCTCDPTAPLTAFDCPATQQFFCEDWAATPPCGCTCNLGAPLGPAACCPSAPDASSSADAAAPADGAAGTYCGEVWTCTWYEPPVACTCGMSIPIL